MTELKRSGSSQTSTLDGQSIEGFQANAWSLLQSYREAIQNGQKCGSALLHTTQQRSRSHNFVPTVSDDITLNNRVYSLIRGLRGLKEARRR